MSSDGSLIPRFRRARRDPSLAVLEGFHALKHALLMRGASWDKAEGLRVAAIIEKAASEIAAGEHRD